MILLDDLTKLTTYSTRSHLSALLQDTEAKHDLLTFRTWFALLRNCCAETASSSMFHGVNDS